MQSHWLVLFCCQCFWHHIHEITAKSKVMKVNPYFLFRICIVWGLMLKYLTLISLFLCMEQDKGSVSFFYKWIYLASPISLFKRLRFLHFAFLALFWRSVDIYVRIYFYFDYCRYRAMQQVFKGVDNTRVFTHTALKHYGRDDFFPLGRPRVTPSALFLANASLVLWLIRFLSISADKPKANAKTLLWMSSPRR